jgi:uncharacterized protein YbjT (DUF2867 family)
MSFPSQLNQQPVLVTGVTGYIGGRLVPRLLETGARLRCLARDASRLQGTAWRGDIELVVGDVLRPESLAEAMHGVVSAYYLVHSLGSGSDFPERDVMAARQFGAAAKNARVKRIIYLGGLGDPGTALSAHLRSRQETGDALRESGVPVTEFRAGVIVGSGSLSFEMIRCLTERLPVMVCPRWVYTRIQPIAVDTVLDYLVEALHVPASAGRTIEIGGADVITYAEMLTFYAEVRGLRRWLIPVPVLTPKLSSYWLHFVTPIPAAIAKPLIAGLRNEILVRDNVARCLFPAIQPPDYRTAVRIALEQLRADKVETAWTGAVSTSQADPPVMLTSEAGMIIEQRQITIDVSAQTVFKAFTGLGGARGWLYMNWAWRLRGALDRLCGGVGLRRGRRDADSVRVGEALDFWRVEAVGPNQLMRLRAEMKVPGKAWLQFEVKPLDSEPGVLLTQTAIFAPKGLLGFVYWYALYPIHSLIFRGLIRKLAKRAADINRHGQPLTRSS